jgi:hypothetical protein
MQLKKEEKNKNIIIKPQINKPSSNQKANRYRDFYKDDDLPTNNNLNKIIQNKKQVVNNKINRYGFNNYIQRERGWFKNNYPDFKYQRPKRAANCKVNYNQINYKDYCLKNNIDKKKNYHFYRENGYYNYNKAINEYKNKNYNIYNPNNYNNKGPHIANIKAK